MGALHLAAVLMPKSNFIYVPLLYHICGTILSVGTPLGRREVPESFDHRRILNAAIINYYKLL